MYIKVRRINTKQACVPKYDKLIYRSEFAKERERGRESSGLEEGTLTLMVALR